MGLYSRLSAQHTVGTHRETLAETISPMITAFGRIDPHFAKNQSLLTTTPLSGVQDSNSLAMLNQCGSIPPHEG
jgi:hypothetical protein